jgi:hypothetical protein
MQNLKEIALQADQDLHQEKAHWKDLLLNLLKNQLNPINQNLLILYQFKHQISKIAESKKYWWKHWKISI